jgi:nitrate/TMAO reductase-like tetraheme cytochrome c subunit
MRRFCKQVIIYIGLTFFVSSLLLLISVYGVQAAPDYLNNNHSLQAPSDSSSASPIVSNDVCLGCHGEPGLTMTLSNGDILDLSINPELYTGSVHGKGGYACVQCHTDLGDYPHPAFSATDLRDVTLQLNDVCIRCHSGEYNLTMDSVHADAQAKGMREAAVCTDCHGAHTTRQWTDPETNTLLPEAKLEIPATCSKCHFEIYQKYETSVHGAALINEENTDVPTCIDCHGVHNIGNPTTNAFRVNSPEMCSKCHTDSELMDKYGISTEVLNTYVSDFHGTTVNLFEKQSPDAPTNKPVCYDCHGVHDISRVDDPHSGIEMQENLLVRCQVCHPDATANFPGAWMSHYIPSANNYALVYYVNLFYKFFIPIVLGGMLALVGLDVGHTVYVKAHKGKRSAQPPISDSQSPTPDETSLIPPQPDQINEEANND